jgi:ribosomal protein S18 acetylase RimI-like enzyme
MVWIRCCWHAWYADFARLNEDDPLRAATTRQLLERLAVRSAFVRVCRAGQTVALGRGALEHGWVGFYEIVTDERYRQQGLGRQLMLSILKWGKDNGAHHAYLQVMTQNTPAVRLYTSLGFTEQYRYWYLQKQPPPA